MNSLVCVVFASVHCESQFVNGDNIASLVDHKSFCYEEFFPDWGFLRKYPSFRLFHRNLRTVRCTPQVIPSRYFRSWSSHCELHRLNLSHTHCKLAISCVTAGYAVACIKDGRFKSGPKDLYPLLNTIEAVKSTPPAGTAGPAV